MAGDWIKVEKVTPDKPEVVAIAARLSIDQDAAFGKCFRVWRWFDDHTTNGHAPSVTKTALDREVCAQGFTDAMIFVGWLHEQNGTIRVPKFERHGSKSAKKRALDQERQSRKRHARRRTKTGLEKRREEKSKSLPTVETPPTPIALPPRLDNQEFRDALAGWCRYKKERREAYKPAGMAAVIGAADKRAAGYGVAAVVQAMQTAQANGWQGWDQKSSFGRSNGPQPTRKSYRFQG